jgi:hypothetical protein
MNLLSNAIDAMEDIPITLGASRFVPVSMLNRLALLSVLLIMVLA